MGEQDSWEGFNTPLLIKPVHSTFFVIVETKDLSGATSTWSWIWSMLVNFVSIWLRSEATLPPSLQWEG